MYLQCNPVLVITYTQCTAQKQSAALQIRAFLSVHSQSVGICVGTECSAHAMTIPKDISASMYTEFA